MIILKGIVFTIALFTSFLYINNILSDISSLMSWNSSLHTAEELMNRNKPAIKYAKFRLILLAIASVSWGIFIMI